MLLDPRLGPHQHLVWSALRHGDGHLVGLRVDCTRQYRSLRDCSHSLSLGTLDSGLPFIRKLTNDSSQVEHYFRTPLDVTRRALKLPDPDAPPSSTTIQPLSSGDLFSHLLLARFFPLLPYSVLNVRPSPLPPFFSPTDALSLITGYLRRPPTPFNSFLPNPHNRFLPFQLRHRLNRFRSRPSRLRSLNPIIQQNLVIRNSHKTSSSNNRFCCSSRFQETATGVLE